MMIKKLFILIFLTIHTSVMAELILHQSNNFISYNHFNPGIDIHHNLLLLSSSWSGINLSIGNTQTTNNDLSNVRAFFTDLPLFYPSPLNLRDGAVLGYGLSRNDMDLELRIYDMFGFEIIRKHFKRNENGGLLGYNRININQDFFNNQSLPAGVYFYIFLHNDEPLYNDKFAVIP